MLIRDVSTHSTDPRSDAAARKPAVRTLGGRMAVVGVGAMGTILGARLAQAGLNVDLIDIDRAHIAALNAKGATVGGTVSWRVPVRALTPDAAQGQYDLVFLLTKQTHNPVVFRQLEPHLHRRSLVCTLQNGVPEPSVVAALGLERTLGGAVTWASTYLGPGEVEATSDPGDWRTLLGVADGSDTLARAALPEVRDVLSVLAACEVVPDLAGVRWSKLLMNASYSGMSAVLGRTFGEVVEDDRALACLQHIARECILVTRALGIDLAQLWPGVDFATSMYFDTEDERLATAGFYRQLCSPAVAGKASMLQDLEAGRQTEVDFINGVLSRKGREVGVMTPVSDTVVRVVKSIERGERRPSMENLRLFVLPGNGEPE